VNHRIRSKLNSTYTPHQSLTADWQTVTISEHLLTTVFPMCWYWVLSNKACVLADTPISCEHVYSINRSVRQSHSESFIHSFSRSVSQSISQSFYWYVVVRMLDYTVMHIKITSFTLYVDQTITNKKILICCLFPNMHGSVSAACSGSVTRVVSCSR